MFSWFRKRRVIPVQAHTYNVAAHELFFPRRASQLMPQWWSDLPQYRDLHPTREGHNLRGCHGLLELHRHSFVLPSWADIYIERTQQSRLDYGSNNPQQPIEITIELADRSTIETHPAEQYGAFIQADQWQHVKILSPWYFEHQEPLRWAWTQPTWALNQFMGDIIILPGIMDFNQQHHTHVNLLIRRAPGSLLIPAGTPLIQLTPMTDRVVQFNPIYKSPRMDLLATRSRPFAFQHVHSRRLSFLRKLQQEKKCPFHLSRSNDHEH